MQNILKELLNKLDNKTVTTGQVVTDDVIDEAPLKVKDLVVRVKGQSYWTVK